MKQLQRTVTALVASFLLVPGVASAQLAFGVACTPGIPGCTSLRFSFTNAGTDIGFNSLNLLLGAGWTFTTGPAPAIGTYSAQDAIGPFAGFTTISMAGTNAAIDFTENGFPFALAGGTDGFLDLEATGTAGSPDASFSAITDDGQVIAGSTISTVPEPQSLVMVAAGFVMIAAGARRRKKQSR